MMNRSTPLVLFRRGTFGVLCSAFLCLLLSSCRSIPPAPNPYAKPPCIRFLLTFDDGPSTRKPYNPTLAIIGQLATNDVQPDIKAIFFVQTENARGGGTPEGREIMRQISSQGHILGIHSVSSRGHVDHTKTPPDELSCSLQQAKNLIRRLTGLDPLFVRPPYGVSNLRTRALYTDLRLNILMADITAHDGIIYGFKASLRRRSSLRTALEKMRKELINHPAHITPFPVVVSFHDVNPYTAKHMTEYLHIVTEEARRVGLTLPDKPFFETPQEVTAAGMSRRIPPLVETLKK